MFWADRIAAELVDRGPRWVDDMKTPSGIIHVGSLRGVILHDVIYKALLDAGNQAKFTYLIDDSDPMDDLPKYLDQEVYRQYMGVPFYKIPSPVPGYKSYAEYYAQDFIDVFNKLGAQPEIIPTSSLYLNGTLNEAIEIALNNTEAIQDLMQQISGSQKRQLGWVPFQPICENCGKVGTTRAYSWDPASKTVEYVCEPSMVKWAQGCGYHGRVSPFNGTGKLPWKVEWPAKWFALGINVEGEGKDHSSAGGSRDIADAITTQIFKSQPPYDIPYEFFQFGGRKMSSSKGVGVSAREVSEILPPELLRFLMIRPRPNQVIDFDPKGMTIPNLFDEYDRCATIYFGAEGDPDFGRAFELAQVRQRPPQDRYRPRFSTVASWIQLPNFDPYKAAAEAKGVPLTELDKAELAERIEYAKLWLEKYAPDDARFTVTESLPVEAVAQLNENQRRFLLKIADELERKPEWNATEFEQSMFNWGKAEGLGGREAFRAIYLALLGRTAGPKAALLILSLDPAFVIQRFHAAAAK